MAAAKPASVRPAVPAAASLEAEVFERVADVALFTETGSAFDEWVAWETVSACCHAGWTARPRPRYADAGVAGSREEADVLVFDPATGRRVLVEIAVIHDWRTNKWIAELDRDTDRLRRAPVPGLQIVMAASLASPIEVNETWRSWLGLSRIWNEPDGLRREIPLGLVGQVLLRGWSIG